jgi:hypothetical protein
MKRLPWRKSKTLAMLANRRQYEREFDLSQTPELEIELEQGNMYLITESSNAALPTYIITE